MVLLEGDTFTLRGQVADPDGDRLTVRIQTPAGVSLDRTQLAPGTGGPFTIRGQALNEGSYVIVLTVSDGEISIRKEITLVVKKR
jgi:hypothetical protein